MLHLLLTPLSDDYIVFNLFRYITFRSFGATLTSLAFCLIFGPWFIGRMRKLTGNRASQRPYLDGHAHKVGTPSMGGVLTVMAIAFSVLLWADLRNDYIPPVLAAMILFALLGLSDDLVKLRNSSRGLGGRSKLALGCLAASAIGLYLWYLAPEVRTLLSVPFFKNFRPDIGLAGFLLFETLVIVGASNSVNLTDGLDGLAIVPVVIAAISLGVLAYLVGNTVYAQYLNLDYVAGSGELAVFCMATVGAGLGFLWYNAPPAQIIMGDSGALAMGASLGAVAAVSKQELVLMLIGGLFVVETLSVIVQIIGYKLTGRRLFQMAPLHHHFEKRGWSESTIVIRFWIIAIVLALFGLTTLKFR